MSILKIVNPLKYPVFQQKTRCKEDSTLKTTTLLTIDDKKPIPLVGYHYDSYDELDMCQYDDENAIVSMTCNGTYTGELKITAKPDNKTEFYIDFVSDEMPNCNTATDNSTLMIVAIPVCGIIKQFEVSVESNSEEVKSELIKVRMAKYGKQEVPVKIVKKDSDSDGTWGFDKVLYIILRLPENVDDPVVKVNITTDHCGRTTNDDGKYEVTMRSYRYEIRRDAHFGVQDNSSKIYVEYKGRDLADERPIGIKANSLGACYEINPYVRKTDKVRASSNDRNSRKMDKDFVNKPRWKDSKKDLVIPPAPDFEPKGKRRHGNKKKSRSKYDY